MVIKMKEITQLYTSRYYITVDDAARITGGWSTGIFPDRDVAGGILLGQGFETHFCLKLGGEENPDLTNPDGTHRYIYDPALSPAYREATAEELAAERAEIEAAREPPGFTAEQVMQQQITDLDLQNIEQGQAITELELQALEQGQAFTDIELRGGNADVF